LNQVFDQEFVIC